MEEAEDKAYTEILGKLPLNRHIAKWFRKKRAEDKGKTGLGSDTRIEIGATDQGIKISLKPGEMEAYAERCDELQQEYEQYEKIYGKKFTLGQDRIILLPLHIQLSNDKWVWLNAILNIFANKMGVLKLELPLTEVPTTPLVDYDINSYIKSIKDVWGVLPVAQNSFEEICDAYLKRISSKCKIGIFALEGPLRNTILVKFDGMPSRVDRIQPEIIQDLYKIIAAPVQNRGDASIREAAREYIKNQSMGDYGIKYITNTAGGCLSITDTDTIDWVKNNYKESNKVKTLDSEDIEAINKAMIRDLSINVEMALVIPILKKINESYIYSQKIMKTKDIHGIQARYKMNVMFISEIQENCYGTVSEQISSFEQMMPYYLKDKITREKMDAVDYILEDKELQKNSLFQNFIAIGGLVMTLVFGFPAIYETLTLIKNTSGMASVDIPKLSVGGVSLIIWIVLICILCLFLLLKSQKGKKIELK